ncbi:MAG: methylated-DNA--[protein]-cysteine S-methyltransferase [Planctomycetota bacterium]|nr:methylated-DNA--[protein]-cysteine S-methyltransferase [Planctomycetota bacterium]
MAWTDNGICALSLNGPNGKFLSQFAGFGISRKDECLPDVLNQLEEYFEGERQRFNISLDFVTGTSFQHQVWLNLMEIPFGETRSYKWLASQMGRPHAFRAVGNANGRNPIPVIVPCHRVINSSGALGGYSGGLDLKRKLLAIEGVDISQLRPS